MEQYSFPLAKQLSIPADNEKNRGILTFSERYFALGYRVFPDPRARTMRIDLLILEVDTGEVARELKTFTVTEAGFPTGKIENAVEVAAWQSELVNLQNKYRDAQSAVDLTRAQEQEARGNYADLLDLASSLSDPQQVENLASDVNLAQIHLNNCVSAVLEAEQRADSARLDLINHCAVEEKPREEYANRYSDIVKYFDNTGAITPDGITWARNLPFFGKTLGYYLK